jgi:phospholipid/cholesterol/gamma-HCH transport system substrate-binding protein
VVGTLNDRRSEITQTLDAMDKLAGRIARQQKVLAQALDAVPGGIAVLDRQRPKLTSTLQSLSRLSRVAVPLINRSKANTVADLKHLAPVLKELSKQGDELSLALERIISFPFPSTFLSTVKGDFAGMYASIALDIDSLNALLAGGTQPPVPSGRNTDEPAAPELPGLPGLPALPGLPGLTGLLGLLGLGGAQ